MNSRTSLNFTSLERIGLDESLVSFQDDSLLLVVSRFLQGGFVKFQFLRLLLGGGRRLPRGKADPVRDCTADRHCDR